jgi:hypothetical protein
MAAHLGLLQWTIEMLGSPVKGPPLYKTKPNDEHHPIFFRRFGENLIALAILDFTDRKHRVMFRN